MGIKTKEELLCQSKSFLDYLENSSKITKEQSEQIFKILSNDNNISTKELVKESLKGVLDSQNFESLYGEYIDYIGGIRNYIKKFQLFEGYEFLDDEFVNLLVRTGKVVKKSEFKPKKIHDIKDEIRKNKDVIRRNIELLENNGFKGKELIISVLGINLGKNLENIKIIQKYYNLENIGDFDNYIDIVYLFFCGNFSDDSMKKLKLFLDAGIKSSQDFIKKPSENSENLSDIIERSYYSINNVELLCGLGINKVEDFLKLDWLLTSQKTDLLNFIIKLLNKNIVAENVEKYHEKEEKYHGYVRNFLLDDEIKGMILNPKSEEAIRLFFYIEGEGNEGKESEMNERKKIETKDLIGDLKLLRPFIQNYNLWKMKNIIQLLLDKVTQDAKTLCSLKEIIEEGNIEILRLLIELEITDAEKLQQLKRVIIKGNEENLKVIINDVGIKGFENILKLQDVVCAGENQKLKVVVEKLKKIRESAGNNGKHVGNNDGCRCSDFLKNLGKTIIDHNNNINIDRLKLMIDAGVYTDENIEKCKDLGRSDLRILEMIVLNMGIKFVDENGELDKNIGILKEIEDECTFKVLNLFKDVKVKNMGQLIELYKILKTNKTDDRQLECAEKNIKEFQKFGITDMDDMLKLKNYIFCSNIALIEGFNLLELTNLLEKSMIIELLPKYEDIFGFLNNFLCNLEENFQYIRKPIDKRLFQLSIYAKELRKSNEMGGNWEFMVESQKNLINLYNRFLENVNNYIFSDEKREVGFGFMEPLKQIFRELIDFSDAETLELILERYPDVIMEDLIGYRRILRGSPVILKKLFEKYKDITMNDLDYLGNILDKSESPESLEKILKRYPNITFDELSLSYNTLKETNNLNLEKILKLTQTSNNELDFEEKIKAKSSSSGKLTIHELNSIFDGIDSGNLGIILENCGYLTIRDLLSLAESKVFGKDLCDEGKRNLGILLKNFYGITVEEIIKYKKIFTYEGDLPEKFDFREKDNKRYLKCLEEIISTEYNDVKKSEMIKKILSLTFREADKYLIIFKMFDDSISMDVQRIKNELIDEILKSEKPEMIANAINDIFERNNLPLTGKIFKVFELLYPKEKFKSTLKLHGSPVLHQYLKQGKNIYELIYKDLMNIAIKSGDRSLNQYLKTFIGSEKLLKNFEGILWEKGFNPDDELCLKGLSLQEKEELFYLFQKISVLYSRYFGKEIEEGNLVGGKSLVSDKELFEFYDKIKRGFNLREGKSLYDRLKALLYVNGLRYHSPKEVLWQMDKSKRDAHMRGLKLYNEAVGGKVDFPRHAFLKGVEYDVFKDVINRGITAREYLGGGEDGNAAKSDLTPFDIDGWFTGKFIEEGYGNIKLVINTDKDCLYNSKEIGISQNDGDKYELFKTGVLGERHYGIRTGIPMTEVDYIIYTGDFGGKCFQNLCYEIARNGYYIPIIDSEGNIKFTPEMYHKIRSGFNYMEYYDGYDTELKDGKYIPCENNSRVNKGYNGENGRINDEELKKLIEENSPNNDKYMTFSKENRELAENTIERIKRILEEKCGIKFNSRYDTSITGAELHDSGSTGRGTDIHTKDVDLDFTLILDQKDYERIHEISKIIHEEIGTQKDDDHGVVEGGNQIKSKINNIGKSDERPDGVPLDLLILKKSQVIDYSSSDAMKEKLDYIERNLETGTEDLERVRTNVIIMKKLLKAKGCYKKPEGGISGIGVENWITQNNGNFIEALESFEYVAYRGKYEPGKQPIPLKEFQEYYPMYDAGENYKDGGNDNFVYKLKENGYKGTLEIAQVLRLEGIDGIRRLIKEYEIKKARFQS